MLGNPFSRIVFAALLVLVIGGGCQRVQVAQPQNENSVSIPFEKYTLDNGLTVILHEDHSDPLVHVDVTYHVGSAREEVGKSGFAHFFEHMMFQGSKHVADEQHFKIITEAGGNLNGTTNTDRTNYFQTVPANQLEKRSTRGKGSSVRRLESGLPSWEQLGMYAELKKGDKEEGR